MNILSLFVLIPLLMLLGLWIARNVNQVRGVMVAGSTLLLALAAYLTVSYIGQRHAGATAEMLFTDSIVWYAPLHICYSVGVDGISVVMLLLTFHHRIYRYICFLEAETAHQRIFLMVHPAEHRSIRILHLNRPVHHVHVL